MNLLDLYRQLDQEAESLIQRYGKVPSCKRGCSHCCYLMVTITPVEGDLITDYILKSGTDIIDLAKKLEKASRVMCRKISDADYLDLQKPCVFLTASNDCSIYEVRPAPCRYHTVISPSETCSVKHRGTKAAVNLTNIEARVFKFCVESGKEVAGPLPLIVLDSLSSKLKTRFLTNIRNRLPTVERWLMATISRDPNKGMKTSDETIALARAYAEVFHGLPGENERPV